MKAVVLLSGGMDSATALYWAKRRGYECYCLTFDYGQRHRKEVECAGQIAKRAKSPCRVIKLDFPWKGSALLDRKVPLPRWAGRGIPVTYVPARNLVFLSIALSWAETLGAGVLLIGAHCRDFSGYPDCRPGFFRDFNRVTRSGTKAGAGGKRIKVVTPLLNLTKTGIVTLGRKLGVPFDLTWSCYAGGERPCLKCAACRLRKHAGL